MATHTVSTHTGEDELYKQTHTQQASTLHTPPHPCLTLQPASTGGRDLHLQEAANYRDIHQQGMGSGSIGHGRQRHGTRTTPLCTECVFS